ncbi:MAG: STAS domain-containing protein [bacterium]
MEIAERGRIIILRPRGQISVGESEGLKRKVEELIQGGRIDILLDLSKVTFMDSSGFGAIAIIKTKIKIKGGRFGIFGLNEKIDYLFEMTRLSDILKIFATEDEGVRILGEEISATEGTLKCKRV